MIIMSFTTHPPCHLPALVDSVFPVPAGPAGAAPSLMCKALADWWLKTWIY